MSEQQEDVASKLNPNIPDKVGLLTAWIKLMNHPLDAATFIDRYRLLFPSQLQLKPGFIPEEVIKTLNLTTPRLNTENLMNVVHEKHRGFYQLIVRLIHFLTYVECIPPTDKNPHTKEPILNEHVKKRLDDLYPKGLYTHQVECFNHLHEGRDVIICTPTASGKTMSFNLFIWNSIMNRRISINNADGQYTALYLYPLNALAIDQIEKIKKMNEGLELKIAYLSGPQAPTDEDKAQQFATIPDILVTNPDIIHYQLRRGSNSDKKWQNWRTFMRRLKYIVIDEAHQFSNSTKLDPMSLLIKRIFIYVDRLNGTFTDGRRKSEQIQFILSSATIPNPLGLLQRITSRDTSQGNLRLVDQSGAETHLKLQGIFHQSCSELTVASNFLSQIAYDCIKSGLKVIIFVRSVAAINIFLENMESYWESQKSALQDYFKKQDIPFPVRRYYGTLCTPEREDTIKEFISGRSVRCLVTTNALEAGIDISDIDVSITLSWPGSRMSILQQIGRCGRKGASLSLYFPLEKNATDSYYTAHPQELFSRTFTSRPLEQRRFQESVLIAHIKWAIVENSDDSAMVENVRTRICSEFGISHEDLKKIRKDSKGKDLPKISVLVPQKLPTVNVKLGKELIESGVGIDQAFRRLYTGALYRRTFRDRRSTYEVEDWIEEEPKKKYKTSEDKIKVCMLKRVPNSGRGYDSKAVIRNRIEFLGTPLQKILNPGTSDQFLGAIFTFDTVRVTVTLAGYEQWTSDKIRGNILTIFHKQVPEQEYNYECKAVMISGLDPRYTHSLMHLILVGMTALWEGAQIQEGKALAKGEVQGWLLDGPGAVGASEFLFRELNTVMMKGVTIIRELDCCKGCETCLLNSSCSKTINNIKCSDGCPKCFFQDDCPTKNTGVSVLRGVQTAEFLLQPPVVLPIPPTRALETMEEDGHCSTTSTN
eukprot:TRINITY_DN7722_c0_g1_i1.p1 TRINITY_DN7722_c0_g1~~TRINITY_DN7722_c0_g1_i1.p1  ORF type:complete len:933 (+),score=61.31 TRINITY_DN7722_c0_g1_i1:100-2898(+)